MFSKTVDQLRVDAELALRSVSQSVSSGKDLWDIPEIVTDFFEAKLELQSRAGVEGMSQGAMSVLAYRAVVENENHFKKLIEESEKIPNSTWEEWLELQVIEKRARSQRLAARQIRIAKSLENLKLAVFAMFFIFVATVFIL
ncbi:MAG: hypothetical protein ACPG0M_00030 [Litorivicinaceae bacterium]